MRLSTRRPPTKTSTSTKASHKAGAAAAKAAAKAASLPPGTMMLTLSEINPVTARRDGALDLLHAAGIDIGGNVTHPQQRGVYQIAEVCGSHGAEKIRLALVAKVLSMQELWCTLASSKVTAEQSSKVTAEPEPSSELEFNPLACAKSKACAKPLAKPVVSADAVVTEVTAEPAGADA